MTAAWDAIARRDLRSWRGLPAGAPYADFTARFPRVVDAEALGLLGRAHDPARYTVHEGEGYSDNLTAWFQGPTLVVVEAARPRLAHSVDDLVAELGEPAARLDDRWGVLAVAGGNRIHPDRGLALFVGPEGQALRVTLFAPCGLDDYLDHVRPATEPLEERPLRGGDAGR